MTSRAASNPASRKMAPNTASRASARMDGRRKPPDLSSPPPGAESPQARGGWPPDGVRPGAPGRPACGTGPLPQAGEALVQLHGDDCIEHAVSQELQALVVGFTEAAMGQGLAQQVVVGEAMADPGGKPTWELGQTGQSAAPLSLVVGLNSNTRLMLATTGTRRSYSMDSTILPPSLVTSRSSGPTVST